MSSARFVVLLVSFAVASLAEKSPFVNFGSFVCPREEKALGRCLRDMINTYIPRLARDAFRKSFKRRLWLSTKRKKTGLKKRGKENRDSHPVSCKKEDHSYARVLRENTKHDTIAITHIDSDMAKPTFLERESIKPTTSNVMAITRTEIHKTSQFPEVQIESYGVESTHDDSDIDDDTVTDIVPYMLESTSLDRQERDQITSSRLSGLRIVDIKYLLDQIQKIKHKAFDCSFRDMFLIEERKIGFQSTFIFECKMCGLKERIKNEKNSINQDIVQGTICSGSNFAQLAEFCAYINMPCMSDKLFKKKSTLLLDLLTDIALASMFEAGKQERDIAMKNGNVDRDGIPYITVVTDGAWCKRSYKTNYNALSGVACIIGFETKKVLFIGVRNSYCSVCAVAANRKVEPQAHRCFKNWSGSSTAMEADGIPEYGIPSCEPLLVPEVTFQQTHGPVTVSSRYSELTVRGPSTMRVKEIQVTPADHKVVAQMQIPQLKIKGRYQMKGQLLVMPIEGEGLCSGDYSNVNATVTIMLDRIPRESGPDALACKALDVIFRVGNATVQLDNLFGGDQQLGGAMNKFINQNWRQVAEELQPAVESSLKDFLKPLADRAFSSLNADEILS